MVIELETNLKDFFKVYLATLGPVFKLTPKELEVAAVILATHYPYRHHPDDHVYGKMFSERGRKMMRDFIGETHYNFRVYLSRLRAKKFLDSDNRIHKFITSNYPTESNIKITYSLTIKDFNESTK